jgi:lysozyme
MIYGTQRSYNTYCAPKYNKYYLYIGRYGKNSPEIKGEGTYTIWQYTENGKVNGITEDVDICKFNSKYGIKDIKVKKK